MYKLVDSLEARLKNLDQSEDAILEMIGKHLASHAGQNAKESKTDSDTELWEEVPRYMVNHATSGVLDIEWDTELYHIKRAVIVG